MTICITQDGTTIIVDGDIIVSRRTREEAEQELARRKAARRAA